MFFSSKKNILIILLILFSFTLFAQNKINAIVGKTDSSFLNDYVSKNWTTEDGLPGMTVNGLLQDKKGYVYICSYDGLVRFDGVEFAVFNRAVDEKYDFASARSIIQDASGNIWVGHNDEGVSCLKKNGEIVKYTIASGLPNNKVNSICEDFDHNIWIGTACGLCYITPQNEIVIPNGVKELKQENILVGKLYCDSAGRVWVATSVANDIFVYSNKKLERFTGISKIQNPCVTEVIQDLSGAFWFGVSPSYAIRIKDGEETVYNISNPSNPCSEISSILSDSVGNYWVGTDAGVTIIHNGAFTYYDRQNGIPDDVITRMLEDNEGNIWIGFNRGGLQKLSRGKFFTVPMETSVNAICEDARRELTWIGTDSGVMCYKNGEFITNKVTELTKGNRVRHVGLSNDNELLISSYSSYPEIVVFPDDTIKIWTEKDGISNRCRVSIKTASGDYYVGTTSGLAIIHKDGNISFFTKNEGLENHYIMWIYEDKKNQIWIGTNGGGVYVLKDEKITAHYSTENGLSGNVIFKILEYADNIWIGTGTGLSRFNEETKTFVTFNSTNGLGTDSVFQMIPDYSSTAWMLTNKGILSVSFPEMNGVTEDNKIKLSSVQYYGSSDGLVTSGVTSTAYSQQDSYGRIWFTLVDGFAVYDPVKSGINRTSPNVDIQKITIDNETFDYNGEKIVLAPSAKRISLKFTGLSFIASEKVSFSYKLEGFDDDYSDWTLNRSVSYTNLKPGTYEFNLVSKNSDGVSGGNITSVTIIKKPYLWQRPWFWGIFIALIVFFIILGFRLNVLKFEREAKEEKDFKNAIIGAFANCVDGKDNYTNGHSQRVADYTKMLATELGENDSTIEKYYNIALLHDIGKIGVPDSILQKPGKLTDEEFSVMKSHAQRGYEILKDIKLQEDLAEGAHYHHERYDGKGYPDGLVGENIPWVARIIAVADTFDAMSSTRPYRKKMELSYIEEEIQRCSGTQFDPKVVDAFMRLYKKGAFDYLK